MAACIWIQYFCLHKKPICMSDFSVQPPLSNIQAELLKLFAANIPEAHLAELKKVIAGFLLEKSTRQSRFILG